MNTIVFIYLLGVIVAFLLELFIEFFTTIKDNSGIKKRLWMIRDHDFLDWAMYIIFGLFSWVFVVFTLIFLINPNDKARS